MYDSQVVDIAAQMGRELVRSCSKTLMSVGSERLKSDIWFWLAYLHIGDRANFETMRSVKHSIMLYSALPCRQVVCEHFLVASLLANIVLITPEPPPDIQRYVSMPTQLVSPNWICNVSYLDLSTTVNEGRTSSDLLSESTFSIILQDVYSFVTCYCKNLGRDRMNQLHILRHEGSPLMLESEEMVEHITKVVNRLRVSALATFRVYALQEQFIADSVWKEYLNHLRTLLGASLGSTKLKLPDVPYGGVTIAAGLYICIEMCISFISAICLLSSMPSSLSCVKKSIACTQDVVSLSAKKICLVVLEALAVTLMEGTDKVILPTPKFLLDMLLSTTFAVGADRSVTLRAAGMLLECIDISNRRVDEIAGEGKFQCDSCEATTLMAYVESVLNK